MRTGSALPLRGLGGGTSLGREVLWSLSRHAEHLPPPSVPGDLGARCVMVEQLEHSAPAAGREGDLLVFDPVTASTCVWGSRNCACCACGMSVQPFAGTVLDMVSPSSREGVAGCSGAGGGCGCAGTGVAGGCGVLGLPPAHGPAHTAVDPGCDPVHGDGAGDVFAPARAAAT